MSDSRNKNDLVMRQSQILEVSYDEQSTPLWKSREVHLHPAQELLQSHLQGYSQNMGKEITCITPVQPVIIGITANR